MEPEADLMSRLSGTWHDDSITSYDRWANIWHLLNHHVEDKRTSHWPLMHDALPTTILVLSYLAFVLSLGPRVMANRKPLQLKNVLILYNFLQILSSSWIVIESWELWTVKYSIIGCQNVDRSWDAENMRICWGFYIYYLIKLSELLDTVFFVVRKKPNQLTFLHLYHHSGMVVMSWGTAKFFPGGQAAFLGFINSAVHVVMYSYYMLAAMGPQMVKYLWWKKWITQIQLIQFGVGVLHFAQILFYDCNYPKWTIVIVFPNGVLFFALFSNFYRKAYQKPDHLLTAKSQPQEGYVLKLAELNCSDEVSSEQRSLKQD